RRCRYSVNTESCSARHGSRDALYLSMMAPSFLSRSSYMTVAESRCTPVRCNWSKSRLRDECGSGGPEGEHEREALGPGHRTGVLVATNEQAKRRLFLGHPASPRHLECVRRR